MFKPKDISNMNVNDKFLYLLTNLLSRCNLIYSGNANCEYVSRIIPDIVDIQSIIVSVGSEYVTENTKLITEEVDTMGAGQVFTIKNDDSACRGITTELIKSVNQIRGSLLTGSLSSYPLAKVNHYLTIIVDAITKALEFYRTLCSIKDPAIPVAWRVIEDASDILLGSEIYKSSFVYWVTNSNGVKVNPKKTELFTRVDTSKLVQSGTLDLKYEDGFIKGKPNKIETTIPYSIVQRVELKIKPDLKFTVGDAVNLSDIVSTITDSKGKVGNVSDISATTGIDTSKAGTFEYVFNYKDGLYVKEGELTCPVTKVNNDVEVRGTYTVVEADTGEES